jgi:hypothetical protein
LDQILAYLFIYKFDSSPQLNSSINLIDGWSLFCPSSQLFILKIQIFKNNSLDFSNDNIYRYFLNNQITIGHQSLIFGFRQLNSTEFNDLCLNSSINQSVPITDQPFNFTSNYQIRVYLSGCYYLDENNQWNSDGLIVSLSLK